MFNVNKKDSLRGLQESAIHEILLKDKDHMEDDSSSADKSSEAGKMAPSSGTYFPNLDMLGTSSSSGSDHVGEDSVIEPTPTSARSDDRYANVILDSKGKLSFKAAAAASEVYKLQAMVKDLQTQLIEAKKSPTDHPEDPSLTKTVKGGLMDLITEESFNILCKTVAEKAMTSMGSRHDKANFISDPASVLLGSAKTSSSHLHISGKKSNGTLNLGTSSSRMDSEDEVEVSSDMEG